MVLQRTLTVQTARVCVGRSREEIVDEVSRVFSTHPVVAIQVGFDIIRVTFRDSDSCKLARNNTHVNIFGSNCVVQGGGPPPTMVHLFDFPAELGDEPVRQVLSGYGNVRSVRRQKYIGRPDIETGTRLVLMTFRATPPRSLIIGGYMCRLWYRGQPLVCNLCNEQGHKSADCPNKDKCRRCGQAGHFARSCPTPWGPVARVEPAASADFPALGDSLVSGLASEPAVSPSSVVVESHTAGASVVDRAVDQACDSFLSVRDLFGDIDSVSDDSEDSICNDSLDDLMASDAEDSNVECSANVNINTETVVEHVFDSNEKTVNTRDETSIIVNAVSKRAVSVDTPDTAPHDNVDSDSNIAAVSGMGTGTAADGNTSSSVNINNEDISSGKRVSDKEISINENNEMNSIIMDDTVKGDINTSGNKSNDETTDCVTKDAVNGKTVDSVVNSTTHDAPEAGGDTVNSEAGGAATADDCMDCATQASQTPEAEDGEIIEVVAAGFSGSSAMDVASEEEASPPQPESPCSTNDAQILSPSQEEASQSILVPVEGWPANPPSSGPQRKARARSMRKSGHHTMPPVVPVVPSRSGPRHRPRHR